LLLKYRLFKKIIGEDQIKKKTTSTVLSRYGESKANKRAWLHLEFINGTGWSPEKLVKMTNMQVPGCHNKAHLLLGSRNWSDEMCRDVLAWEPFRETVEGSGADSNNC
jgi:hypothetical protein